MLRWIKRIINSSQLHQPCLSYQVLRFLQSWPRDLSILPSKITNLRTFLRKLNNEKKMVRIIVCLLFIWSSTGSTFNFEDAEVGGCDVVALQQAGEGRTVVATRTPAEREKNPDRICLDRRGLTLFPEIISEPKLRLMSLQHNLISRIDGDHFAQLTKLVFLDLYDNQIEKISELRTLENLRVLLIGKNRIKKIEGLKPLTKLEVLDLHGNQIVQISGLDELASLKVLNLAGNNVKTIGFNDFHGLTSLRELNLKRNKIKKLLGFGETPQLQKLYLSNNDIQKWVLIFS